LVAALAEEIPAPVFLVTTRPARALSFAEQL